MLFFTLPCAPPLRPAVPAAGHARRSNKGCTKRQSLPNCQHNGRIPPYDRPGSSGPGVILAERPGRNGICQAGGRQKTGGRTRAPGNYTGNLQGRPAGMGKSNRGKEGSPKNKGDRKNKSRRKGIRENIGKNRECRRRQELREGKLPGETGQAAGCFTGGNRGDATQTGMQEQTVKKTETWMPRGAATTVNTAERHCGSRTMRTKRTIRTARTIRMIRSSADGANGANGADGADGADWCESATRWTGRRGGESGERIERKKQACENAGPTTRPESRSES